MLKDEGCACRMGLNLFSMQLNEMTPGLEAKLPPTDTRWRKDLRAIEKVTMQRYAHHSRLRRWVCQRLKDA